MKNDEELSREFQREHGKAMGKYDRAYRSTKKEVRIRRIILHEYPEKACCLG